MPKTDIEIARTAKKKHITEIAQKLVFPMKTSFPMDMIKLKFLPPT